ncbi:hypothetical protein HPB50_009281 [Hyalomma asiaticum]|uniref:Uncharacterized protein n=1 Tax=Hyalomma asiaticum TaxID=266040 RepID=A0ACB7TH03_HYAAI|nr:hypothetical protein HPB50_009281 [Hyalomma asiaticum]
MQVLRFQLSCTHSVLCGAAGPRCPQRSLDPTRYSMCTVAARKKETSGATNDRRLTKVVSDDCTSLAGRRKKATTNLVDCGAFVFNGLLLPGYKRKPALSRLVAMRKRDKLDRSVKSGLVLRRTRSAVGNGRHRLPGCLRPREESAVL